MKFCFGDIVVVDKDQIGVIVKCWIRNNESVYYEVYVSNYYSIKEYEEKDIERYMVRHKELDEQELEWQHNATHPFIPQEEMDMFAECMKKGDFSEYAKKYLDKEE